MSAWFETYGFADVYDKLVVGAVPLDRRDVRKLTQMGVDRVFNLVQDEEYQPGSRVAVETALEHAGIAEYRLGTLDFGGLTPELLDEAVGTINGWLDEGRVVYVHCRAGWQRSACVAAAVVAVRENVDVDAAVATIQTRKPSADPLPHQRDDLRRWWTSRCGNGVLS